MAGAELGRLAIAGGGRVGRSIARAAAAAGVPATVLGRGEIGSGTAAADAVLLCVPDDAIAALAAELARSPGVPGMVGHTSGATGLAALAPCAGRGSAVFSLHPLQTIPDADTDLTGAPCAVAGSDAEAELYARSLAEALAMRPFAVPDEHRAAYHAAAVIAANFLVALEESAAGLLGRVGVDDARDLLAPLVLRSAANWAERGGEALTGPIARGDRATVAGHLAALAEIAPELVPLYEVLAERTADLARGRENAR